MDSHSHDDQEAKRPPTPPPLPPTSKANKVSKFALKVASAPPGWGFVTSNPEAVAALAWDPLVPPAGKYFFYGTLQDPGMLTDILNLDSAPTLQPAQTVGYTLKLWGQYPALVHGKPGEVVKGSCWDVPSEAAAARLAEYETKSYDVWPCNIILGTGDDAVTVDGWTFMYRGRESELSEGTFDLGVWLKHMRR